MFCITKAFWGYWEKVTIAAQNSSIEQDEKKKSSEAVISAEKQNEDLMQRVWQGKSMKPIVILFIFFFVEILKEKKVQLK